MIWSELVQRLRQRKIVQWAIAYLAGAFALLQVLDLAAQPFAWPDLVLRAAWVILGVGFLAALILAWYHGEKGQQRASGLELLMLAVLFVIAGAGVALVAARGPARADDTRSAAAGEAEHASVVVLPFADLSPGHDQEYFSDGLTEEILNALVRLPQLRVPARTTSFAFKGRNVPVQEIARQLNVAHVLEGSVRKAGDRLRITAQLIDARTDAHLWSETYDRDLADVFAVQEEIARAVVAELAPRLQVSALRGTNTLQGAHTPEPAVYELYLRGMHAWNQRTPAALQEAARYFEQAVARDSLFARAWAGLAATYVIIPEWTDTPASEWVPRVRHAAGRALALDDHLVEAHSALAYAYALDGDVENSRKEFERALEVNPSYATAHQWYGSVLNSAGRTAEGTEHLEKARELDPLSFIINANLGDHYLNLRRFTDAIARYERALELNPGSADYRAQYAVALLLVDRTDDAVRALEAARPLLESGSSVARGMAGYALARTGRVAEARMIGSELEQQARTRYVSPMARAYVQIGLGDNEGALAMLEEGERIRDAMFRYYFNDPVFDPIRSDPRYVRMRERQHGRLR